MTNAERSQLRETTVFKDENREPPKTSPLPAMKRRLWQSFVCIAALGIATGAMALLAINQQANEFEQASTRALAGQEMVRDSLLQQLGIELLQREWQNTAPTQRQQLMEEMRQRQQTMVMGLSDYNAAERDMAIQVLQGLENLQSSEQATPRLKQLSLLTRDLAIRLSSLNTTLSQQHFAMLEKRRSQLNITVMFLSLLFILCSQYLAWALLGRHFIRPLLHLGQQLNAITAHDSENTPALESVNREVKDISDNLQHIHRQLQHHHHNPERDTVTGLASRKAFNQHLQQEWLRGLRREEPVSLLLLGVDPIMLQGDTELAEVPAQALQHLVAITSQHTARAQDFLARFDTNRFAVVLSSTDLEQAIKLAQQLCHKVSQARIATPLLANQPWLSLSVGVANQIPTRPHSWDNLVQEAEEALIQARSQGGNQATVAPCILPHGNWRKIATNR